MKLQGQVLWYDKRDGYGQAVDSNNTRYYIDGSVLLDSVDSGDLIEFEINTEIKSCLCGKNVNKRGAK